MWLKYQKYKEKYWKCAKIKCEKTCNKTNHWYTLAIVTKPLINTWNISAVQTLGCTYLFIGPIIVHMKDLVGMSIRYVYPPRWSIYPQSIGPPHALRDEDCSTWPIQASSLQGRPVNVSPVHVPGDIGGTRSRCMVLSTKVSAVKAMSVGCVLSAYRHFLFRRMNIYLACFSFAIYTSLSFPHSTKYKYNFTTNRI